jgi:ureidoglycolate hydrolase
MAEALWSSTTAATVQAAFLVAGQADIASVNIARVHAALTSPTSAVNIDENVWNQHGTLNSVIEVRP